MTFPRQNANNKKPRIQIRKHGSDLPFGIKGPVAKSNRLIEINCFIGDDVQS